MMNIVEKSEDIEKLWHDFLTRRDRASREKLLEHYLFLVRIVVGRILYLLPPYIDREDLEGYGILGLLQALDRFEPRRGVRFETYALSRIRGAILDYLRSLDPLTRGERQNLRRVLEAWRQWEKEKGEEPTLEDLSEVTGLSLREITWLVEQGKPALFFGEEEEIEGEGVREVPDPSEVLEDRELLEYLGRLIDELPERERLILSLYYFEGLTLREIGEVLSVSEGRVSQILTRILLRLRMRLEEWEGKQRGEGREKAP
uniref:FliA/WhiG family RNA polymerase sigma factor n=1 Tax=Candidatus Caldatribacterium californiense TaxID=1454726 RepID=A0A7V3YF88_9BACT